MATTFVRRILPVVVYPCMWLFTPALCVIRHITSFTYTQVFNVAPENGVNVECRIFHGREPEVRSVCSKIVSFQTFFSSFHTVAVFHIALLSSFHTATLFHAASLSSFHTTMVFLTSLTLLTSFHSRCRTVTTSTTSWSCQTQIPQPASRAMEWSTTSTQPFLCAAQMLCHLCAITDW
jgi:hypothetical protein